MGSERDGVGRDGVGRDGVGRDDELARTATAPVGASAPAAPITPIASTLGRYRIERELGAGGMGVVHAAFDPDLERRVALKVLRSDDGRGDARQRLLREARAMARLAHPNVVTVHEVGSAGGRDFVAMELVDGETLADWLRSAPRTAAEIITAFVAAARGLAAAHAAGIVHRDFKPHNVLRHTSGRIVVTDFGLARDAADAVDPIATVASSPRAKATVPLSGSTPLSGLTVTGSVLGTPAYMAPEQWSGSAVTPATDQFAYCVALWEALAGERPFRGLTIEQLRSEVERGPAALDASKIPRRLRAVLRRGLDPDPKRRWPSMEALLAAMSATRRRPVLALALAGLGVVVAGSIIYASRSAANVPASVPLPGCPAPITDPAQLAVEAPVKRDSARDHDAYAIHDDVFAWQLARDRACGMDPATRQPLLTCLDGVMARLAAVAEGVKRLAPKAGFIDVGRHLIDPAVCSHKRLPHLEVTSSPGFRDVIASALHEEALPGTPDAKAMTALVERVKGEPCAAALAHVLAAESAIATDRERHLAAAEQDAQNCDDRVRAEVALAVAKSALASGFLGTTISSKVQLATSAVERVTQSDLVAEIDLLRMETALRADNLDDAIERGETAMRGYEARKRIATQIATGLTTLDLRELRSSADDLERVKTSPAKWRAHAEQKLGHQHAIVYKIDSEIAARMFLAGDVEAAHHRLENLRIHNPAVPQRRPRRFIGRVVDVGGKPVIGAEVVAGTGLLGSSVSATIPWPTSAPYMRVVTTDATGAFTFEDAPDEGIVIAQQQGMRSLPAVIAADVKLVLEPTTRIEGRVDLRGEPPTRVIISAQDLRMPLTTRYEMLAPVRPDGSFSLDGVPRARLRIFAALRIASSRTIASVTVDTRGGPVKNVQLAVANQNRMVHVIVRSTVGMPVANAQVLVFPGQLKSTTADKLDLATDTTTVTLARQIEGEKAPPAVIANARPGDMFASMRVPEGAASACVIGLPNDLSDDELDKKVRANLAKIEVRCAVIPPATDTVIVEVPPWPRLD